MTRRRGCPACSSPVQLPGVEEDRRLQQGVLLGLLDPAED
jgi:hypothetical protein